MASLVEVKAFFEFFSTTAFREEWNALADEDKVEIRLLVGKELGK